MKTVLITGASSGFGKEAAKTLSQKGYKLILTSRRRERLEELAASLETPVHIAAFDVQNRQAVKDFYANLPEEFQEIDILINNAGLGIGVEPIEQCSLDDWDTMVATNISGLLYMTHGVSAQMKKRGSGMIINLGSVAGICPYPGGNTYGATKAFVKQFSRNLRLDFHGTGVRVTTIAPGAAETEFSDVRFKGDVDKAKKVYENMDPLTAEDIAETILWVIERPLHVNIDNIDIMPTAQAWGGISIYRGE